VASVAKNASVSIIILIYFVLSAEGSISANFCLNLKITPDLSFSFNLLEKPQALV